MIRPPMCMYRPPTVSSVRMATRRGRPALTRQLIRHQANPTCPHGCTCGIPLGLAVDGGLSGCAPVEGGGGDDSEPPAAASPPSVAAPLKPPGAGVGALPREYTVDRTEEAHLGSETAPLHMCTSLCSTRDLPSLIATKISLALHLANLRRFCHFKEWHWVK
jgi:hypothetical protein